MKYKKFISNYFKNPFIIWAIILLSTGFFLDISEVQNLLNFVWSTYLHLVIFGIAFALATIPSIQLSRKHPISHHLKDNRSFLFVFISFTVLLLSAEIPLYFMGILNLIEIQFQFIENQIWYNFLTMISSIIGFFILPGLMIAFHMYLLDFKNIFKIIDTSNEIVRKLISSIPFLILIPVFWFTYESLSIFTINDDLLIIFISASSIIVALIIGFLFNSYFNIKQMRLEKLSRFAELQNEIRPYQRAFWSLADQISRKYGHKMFQFPRPFHELQRDEELSKTDEYVPIIWTRAIHDASSLSFDTPDFEKTYQIISKERLDEMYEQVSQAMGLLGRHKHFKYLLKVFKLPDTQDLDQVNIAENVLGMEYYVKEIQKEGENYKTLGFWESKLEEWHDVLERMRSIGRFVYSFVSSEIKLLSIYLLFIAGFGVIMPILLLSLSEIPQELEVYLRNLTMIGFVTYFSLSLRRVYTRLTSDRLSYD